MKVVIRPWCGEPRQWIITFCYRSATPWLNRLPIGRYRHVRAFGYVPEANAWIFFDPAIERATLAIACDGAAKALMAEWLTGADAISMPARTGAWHVPALGGWCVQAIKHLIGLRGGALRPDRLWHDCLANGGEIVAHERIQTADGQHSGGPLASAGGTASAG